MLNLISSLIKSVDPALLLARIAEQVCIFSPKAEGAAVGLLGPQDQIIFVSAHGLSAPLLGYATAREGSFHEVALRECRLQSIDDVTSDPRVSLRTGELAVSLGIRSWLVIPLHCIIMAMSSVLYR